MVVSVSLLTCLPKGQMLFNNTTYVILCKTYILDTYCTCNDNFITYYKLHNEYTQYIHTTLVTSKLLVHNNNLYAKIQDAPPLLLLSVFLLTSWYLTTI